MTSASLVATASTNSGHIGPLSATHLRDSARLAVVGDTRSLPSSSKYSSNRRLAVGNLRTVTPFTDDVPAGSVFSQVRWSSAQLVRISTSQSGRRLRSEEHTSELQPLRHLVF